MRKVLIFLQVVIVSSLLFSSCDNSKTYAERLDEEKSLIAKLIADSFVVIPFNKDSLYTKQNKHIMKMSDGLYIAVISKGNMQDTAVTGTVVTYRFKNSRILQLSDTIIYENVSNQYPLEFAYKKTSASAFMTSTNLVSCEGVQKPLTFLGNGAKVKLIIPSKISFTDLQDVSIVQTLYFDELTYKFSVR